MALNLVCAVLDRGPQDLAEMAVLLAIADSADKDSGEAWPSQVTIARRARQTDRGVRNVLARLRRDGWLTWEPRQRANGSRASNVYTLNLAMLGEAREGVPAAGPARNPVPGTPRNPVPGGSGTPFRGVPERRSGHAPEPRSPLEPSQKIEPRAREAQPVGQDASGELAEKQEGRTGGGEAEAGARAERLRKADLAASLNQRVLSPDCGEWIAARDWLAMRAASAPERGAQA